MFAAIGRFSVRFPFEIIAFWLFASLGAAYLLPSLSNVSPNQAADTLPSSAPSVQAAGLESAIVGSSPGSAVIVAVARNGKLTSADLSAIDHVEHKVRGLPQVNAVVDEGVSADEQAREVLVETNFYVFDNNGAGKQLVVDIRRTFGEVEAPTTLELHLTGELAEDVDQVAKANQQQLLVEWLSIGFIIVLLLIAFRAALAPVVALLPAALALEIAERCIAQVNAWGAPSSALTGYMLVVVMLGVGTDYGLFLIFRMREELYAGLEAKQAVVKAVERAGEVVTFSASTLIVAFMSLLLASFLFFRGLGPALAIGIAIVVAVDLTLLPAVLVVLGKAVFWPRRIEPGPLYQGGWGRVTTRIARHPGRAVLGGVVLMGTLALFTLGYSPGGFGQASSRAAGDSAAGLRALTEHFPEATTNPTDVVFALPVPVWVFPEVISQAQRDLDRAPEFKTVAGALDPNGTVLTPVELAELHSRLGPADKLSIVPPSGTTVSVVQYEAYRSTAQFISSSGSVMAFHTTLRAGSPNSDQALHAIPQVRSVVTAIGQRVGVVASGVAGDTAGNFDESTVSKIDLFKLVPIVLVLMALLLAWQMGSLVAPLYMIASIGLSYMAALGSTVLVFGTIGGTSVEFVLPFVAFIFLLTLGEDYNILVMNRIREEARRFPLDRAVQRAMERTGITVTSAGLILAGTFAVLAVATSGAARQIGFCLAVGIALDVFIVRTILMPSVVMLLGRWNWWPSQIGEGELNSSYDRRPSAS